jgi:hypothetical protein
MNQKRGKTLQKAEAQGHAGQAVAGRRVFHLMALMFGAENEKTPARRRRYREG